MKFGIFSDLHLHRWMSFGIDEQGMPVRLKDQIDVVEQIKSTIIEKKIDRIIFGGDLYHKVGEVPVECINIAHDFFQFLRRNDIPYYLVGGNHDFVNREMPQWYHYASRPFDSVPVDDGGVLIKLVNYVDPVDYDEIKGYDIVVLHKQPTIVNDYGYKFEGVDWERLAENNRFVFFGHYHERTMLSGNCFVIGSTMPLTFGDVNDRGMWIVDTDNWSVDFIALKSPKFITVDTPEQVKRDGNYYRVLHADKRVDDNNVITVIEPQHFDERIKSSDFNSILNEWLDITGKDKSYLTPVESTITGKFQSATKVFDGRLRRIFVRNFISIGEIDYSVKNGFTLVSGRNDVFDSNGSGKTSLFEAVYWCLFGETTKGLTGNDVIRRGEKDCEVVLELDGDDRFGIKVYRSRKDGLNVEVVDPPDSRSVTEGFRQTDRQAILEALLGFDKNIFLASCYFSQESLSMFTQLGDVDRTNMITKLLGFEKYDDLYVTFKDLISTDSVDVTSMTDEINNLQSSVAINENEKKNILERMADANNSILNINSKMNVINRELAGLNERLFELNKVEVVKIDESKFNDEISALMKQEDDINAKIDELYKSTSELEKGMSDKKRARDGFTFDLKYNRAEIDKLNKEIAHLNSSHFGERCDKCGATIDKNNINIFIDEKNAKIKSLEQTNVNIDESVQAFDIEIESLKAEIDELKANGASLDVYTVREKIKEVNKLKDEHLKKKNEVEIERTKIMTSIDQKNDFLFSYTRELKSYEQSFASLNNKLTNVEKLIKSSSDRISELLNNLNNLKNRIEIFEYWKNAFSPKGIRSLLLDRFCNEFNRLANEYLSTASSGVMSVSITPTKQLKSGEERNKIGIDILMNGESVKYESLSGGEKRRIDASVCLAVNKWISLRFNVSHGLLGIMVLDELFANIDRLGEETIATLLHNEGMNKAVFVISHTPELSSYANRIITVVKENGVSRLENTFEYQ